MVVEHCKRTIHNYITLRFFFSMTILMKDRVKKPHQGKAESSYLRKCKNTQKPFKCICLCYKSYITAKGIMNTKLKYYFSLIKGQCGYESAATLFCFDFTHNKFFSFMIAGIAHRTSRKLAEHCTPQLAPQPFFIF